MTRPVNFSAGPSIIPVDVLETLAKEMVDYRNTGLSLLEVSHRGPVYSEVHQQAQTLLRELMNIPENYSVLFLGGGATLQFSMVPMNILKPNGHADYVISGTWAKKALQDAEKIGSTQIIWNGEDGKFLTLPEPSLLKTTEGSSYVHITSNETINGVQWKSFPETGTVPLVADMSSDILSRPVDVSKFGLIYAGAQKNLAPSGATLVIIRNDLLERSPKKIGAYLNYSVHAKADSLYNTPPVFPIWAMKLMLENVKLRGGTKVLTKTNKEQAARVYQTIDSSNGFYSCPVDLAVRSDMNVVWRLPDEEKEALFLKEAAAKGLSGLKGHRSVGGCRASLYNAMTDEGVQRLVEFMKEFAKKKG